VLLLPLLYFSFSTKETTKVLLMNFQSGATLVETLFRVFTIAVAMKEIFS